MSKIGRFWDRAINRAIICVMIGILFDVLDITTEHLTRLHYKPGMLKTVSKWLKVLTDNGYIQADCIPTKLFKSPFYYALATRGIRYLDSIGLDTPAGFRQEK